MTRHTLPGAVLGLIVIVSFSFAAVQAYNQKPGDPKRGVVIPITLVGVGREDGPVRLQVPAVPEIGDTVVLDSSGTFKVVRVEHDYSGEDPVIRVYITNGIIRGDE